MKKILMMILAAAFGLGAWGVTVTTEADLRTAIASGGTVKYIGIPTGTKAEVTETNNVTGTTYTTTLTVDGSAAAFTGGTAALADEDKTATMPDGATAIYAPTAAPAADTSLAVQFTNTLSVISPTGYVVRFAPYVAMLIGGIALLVVAKKHRKHTEEDE